MERRGPVTAYAAPQTSPRSRRTTVLTVVLGLVMVLVFVNVSRMDGVVAEGRHAVGRLQENMQNIPRPFSHLHNPFKQHAHPPPVQDNSTLGEASWFSDWKWLNPFSSMVTLDEDRALLPPFADRPPIYTYYEPRTGEADAGLKKAEDKLVEVWRRAWWAQGFRPVVLGPPDAMENAMYQRVQSINMTAGVQTELMRFLAWSHMGDGILANWLVVPMAGYYNPLLVYLRNGRYVGLTRYIDLGMGLFDGPKAELDKAIEFFLTQKAIESDDSLMKIISDQEELFEIDARRRGVAFYNKKVIKERYKDVADVIESSGEKGYSMLADLVSAHLHYTFLNQYPEGLAVVSPYIQSATLIPHRGAALATSLNTCPSNPKASPELKEEPLTSCPPNMKDCTSCKPVPLNFPPSAPNNTKIFTIGTVAHTYTMSRLLAPHRPDFNFTVRYVRRETMRDPFVNSAMAEMSLKSEGGYTRIVALKEAIAQPGKGAHRSVWRHAEADWSWEELEWRLGFPLSRPAQAGYDDKEGNPVPQRVIPPLEIPASAENKFPDVLRPLLDAQAAHLTPEDLVEQSRIVKETGDLLSRKGWPAVLGPDMRKVSEAWHLADAEAWRFVRALAARDEVERKKWMEDEKSYRL